ncbi:hypothetical protein AMATHDRAFT_161574 [Amanita thiersii Skay4041]|uniref:Alpha/beta hydrolase fold-3 domain-containing protein n=1 Tax=Amanita thiersii Skay4041 TaxID=703135 RepID=A0A2A9NAG9_9AGAR|nr:hypothetical protein AMATHDRAFT_161574 [Amanita thiersii Skay4041]
MSIAIYLTWKLLTKPFSEYTRNKTWRRILGDASFRYLGSLGLKKLLYLMGTTPWVYTTWAKWYKLPITVTELGDDARLLWIGPKKMERVILYLHGGGYVAPMQHFTATFWRYLQLRLESRGIDVGIAVLNYSLVPSKLFPAQLHQAISAVEYLLSAGVSPANIQITGDSAGGNLAFALLSHMLHPLEGVPQLTVKQPFRGVYAMSPWVSLTADTGSYFANSGTDILPREMFLALGSVALTGVQAPQKNAYIQPLHAPSGWWAGADRHVDRFLITAGEKECLYEDIVVFGKQFCEENPDANVRVVEQPNGVHNDPFFDFMVMEPKLGVLTPIIVDWFANGFGQ